MENINSEKDVFIENLIELRLPQDLQKATTPPREAIYYLRSLATLYREHAADPKDFKEEEFLNNNKRIEACFKEFEVLEKKLYYPEERQKIKGGGYKVEIDFEELIEIIKRYIFLKEKIDILQLDILKYLFNVDSNLISNITSKEKFLKDLKVNYMSQILTYSVFEQSADEDKLDNYRIYIEDSETVKEFSKDNIYPIPLKIKNYDFLLRKYRNLYKKTKLIQVQILNDSSRLREEKEINKMSKEQFRINKKMKLLTITTTILTIVGLIYGTISTYFLLTDSNDLKSLENQNKVIDELQNVGSELKTNRMELKDINQKLDSISKSEQ